MNTLKTVRFLAGFALILALGILLIAIIFHERQPLEVNESLTPSESSYIFNKDCHINGLPCYYNQF